MRYLGLFLVLCGFHPAAPPTLYAQTLTPVVPFGGIYELAEATVTPDPTLDYQLVIDVVSGAEEPDSLAQGLHNVARMLNLFAVGGVPEEHVTVVLAIHGGATFSVLKDEEYRRQYGTDNPNLPLLRALKETGVRLTVCGQSLIGRRIPPDMVAPEVEIATSMLTTVAMYQMRGYGMLRF